MKTKRDYEEHVRRYLEFKGYKYQQHDFRAFAHQAWSKRWAKLRTNAEIEAAFGPREIVPFGYGKKPR